jgi:hypothetical protein
VSLYRPRSLTEASNSLRSASTAREHRIDLRACVISIDDSNQRLIWLKNLCQH